MNTIECQAAPPYDWRPLAIEDSGYAEEPMGTKGKFWLLDVGEQKPWLFKYARHKVGRTNGSDWAEALVHVIAKGLSIPSTCVALATHDGERGILSRSVLTGGDELTHGNELLGGSVAGYDSAIKRLNPLYTVANVRTVLEGVSASDPRNGGSAFDQWASYLVLDALVAGRTSNDQYLWMVFGEVTCKWRTFPGMI